MLVASGGVIVGSQASGGGGYADIAEALADFGKDSVWADFSAGVNAYPNSDGTGTITDGAKVNRWNQQAGNGFAHYFHNTTNQGLFYRSSLHGAPALQGVSDGDQFLFLSNTTVFNNLAYTVIMRFVAIKEAIGTAYIYGHSSAQEAINVTSAGAIGIRSGNTPVNCQHVYHTQVDRINSTDGEAIVGFVTAAGSGHNGAAINLGRRIVTGGAASDYSGSGVKRLILVGTALTSEEMDLIGQLM